MSEQVKTVTEPRLSGTVKWFNVSKGYGFIERQGEETDIFVHLNSLPEGVTLQEGQHVTFLTETSRKGLRAVSIKVV